VTVVLSNGTEEGTVKFNAELAKAEPVRNQPVQSDGQQAQQPPRRQRSSNVQQPAWIDRIGRTWVFNPGRDLGPIPAHLSLDLDAMSAEWISAAEKSTRQLELPGRRFARPEALCRV
jgi:hypothetical protein